MVSQRIYSAQWKYELSGFTILGKLGKDAFFVGVR